MTSTAHQAAHAGQDAIHWDLQCFYPSLRSEEYLSDKRRMERAIKGLAGALEASPALTQSTVDEWAGILDELERLESHYLHLWTYTYCLLATAGKDQDVAEEHTAVMALQGELKKLSTVITARFRDLDDEVFKALEAHPALAGVGHVLARRRSDAQSLLEPGEESLLADLDASSVGGWGRLRNTIANNLEFSMDWPDGRSERLPVSRQIDLMAEPDAAVREAAATGITRAWETEKQTIAACFNGIAGTRIVINQRRGHEDALTEPLLNARITRRTLHALMSAVRQTRHLWWRYLKLKAMALGQDRIAIHDRLALLPLDAPARYSANEATGLILDAFDWGLPELAAYTRVALAGQSVEYATGPGYSGTGVIGFSAYSPELKLPLVYTEYHGSLMDINVLAHELGHGFHSHVVSSLRLWQADYPPTLAESASNVAEGLLRHYLVNDSKSAMDLKLRVLGMQLDAAVNNLLRIPRDFEFEAAFYRLRAEKELGADQITGLMARSHDDWFGNSLRPEFKDEMHWASRSYFCYPYGNFINFPYVFGFLFSASLLRRLTAEGPGFAQAYRNLLLETGSSAAEDLAQKHLGVDLTGEDFWLEEITALAAGLEQFEALAAQRFPQHFNQPATNGQKQP